MIESAFNNILETALTFLLPALILLVVFGGGFAAKYLRSLDIKNLRSFSIIAALSFLALFLLMRMFTPHLDPLSAGVAMLWMALFTWPLLLLPNMLERFLPMHFLSRRAVYVATAIPVIWGLTDMPRAELGAIFIPFFALILSLLSAGAVWSLCLVLESLLRIRPFKPLYLLLAVPFPALAIAVIVFATEHNRQVAEAGKASDPHVIAALAHDPLAQQTSGVDAALAKNMNTSAETLSTLVARGLEMAESPEGSDGWTRYVERYQYIMRDIGWHPNLAVSDIEKIFAYCNKNLIPCYSTAEGIAANLNTPPDILRALVAPIADTSRDQLNRVEQMDFDLYRGGVGMRLACNPSSTHEILLSLLPFEGTNATIHDCLAHHPKSSCDMLKELVKSKYKRVSQKASDRLAAECQK